ncbi:MAG: ABC transporter permease [Acidobacteriota bacterium]
MAAIVSDLRHAIRLLAKTPGFTAVAVLILALGIGLNTAVFTLVNSLVLRPRPGSDQPGEVVGLYNYDTSRPDQYREFSYPAYRDIREQNQAFLDVTAVGAGLVGLGEAELTRRVFAFQVGANYFSTFGVRPALGRAFLPEEEAPGAQRQVVILSDEYWRKTGADPDVLGTTLRVNTREYTVVGVAPRGFGGPSAVIAPAVYLPLGVYESVTGDVFRQGAHSRLDDRANATLLLFARLRPGMSIPAAESSLKPLAARLEEAYPGEHRHLGIRVRPLSRASIGSSPQSDDFFGLSALLLGTSVLVLVIACMNLANMLLARASARRREFAIRLAIGASGSRVFRQLFVEGLVLSLAGSAAGLLLTSWAIQAFTATIAPMLPLMVMIDARPDARVLATTLGLALLSTLAFSLGPALSLARTDMVTEIKEGERSGPQGPRRWFNFRHALVVGQIALSMTLLTAAGLFVRGAINASHADPGFSLDRSLIVTVDPGLAGIDEERGRAFYARVLERVRALPGVPAASLASVAPFGDFTEGRSVRKVGDRPAGDESAAQGDGSSVSWGSSSGPADARDGIGAAHYIVGSGYFETLGIPIRRGRGFSQAEEASSDGPRVAIIDEPLATRLFPEGDAIGQHIYFPGREAADADVLEVVGIAGGTRHSLFDKSPVPHVFVPSGQRYRSAMHLHLRVESATLEGQAAVLRAVRREIRAADGRVPILTMSTMGEFRDRSLSSGLVRAGANLFAVFGGLAVVLAVIGIYGVRAYLVSRRTREIGIRIALGATAPGILWLVVREGARLVAMGLGIGLMLSLGTGLALASALYDVSPFDPWVFSIAPALLALSALAACYVPARRAARLSPVRALRAE